MSDNYYYLFIFNFPFAVFIELPFFSFYYYSFVMSIIKFRNYMTMFTLFYTNTAFDSNFINTNASYRWNIFCFAY